MIGYKVTTLRTCRADDDKKPKLPELGAIILPNNDKRPIANWPSRYPNRRITKITTSGTATTDKNFSGAHVVCFVNWEPKLGEVIRIRGIGEKSVSGELIPRPKNL